MCMVNSRLAQNNVSVYLKRIYTLGETLEADIELSHSINIYISADRCPNTQQVIKVINPIPPFCMLIKI